MGSVLSLGDSWLVARTGEHRRVADALSGAKNIEMATLENVLDAALRQEALVIIPAGALTLVVPGMIEPAQLVSLSAVLDTDVYAFEANDDYGLAIRLARRGELVRDRYECPAEGIFRDEGPALSGEPEALGFDDVIDFATAATTAPCVSRSTSVLVYRAR